MYSLKSNAPAEAVLLMAGLFCAEKASNQKLCVKGRRLFAWPSIDERPGERKYSTDPWKRMCVNAQIRFESNIKL